ncbi:MAG: PGPGW domain-containing protein [Anaerosomatales bacterium]|nr:PGPGW domain-containing protein [Anaerosomatales bacterium]
MSAEKHTPPDRAMERTVRPEAPGMTEPLSPTAPPESRSGCASFVLGGILVLIGVPMLVCPGPGIATILAGLGLMGFGTARRVAEKDTDAHP